MRNKQRDGGSSISPKQKWEAIPDEFREKIIRNVWCTHCKHVVSILDYRVYSSGPDIVLRGRCDVCSGEVARVVGQDSSLNGSSAPPC